MQQLIYDQAPVPHPRLRRRARTPTGRTSSRTGSRCRRAAGRRSSSWARSTTRCSPTRRRRRRRRPAPSRRAGEPAAPSRLRGASGGAVATRRPRPRRRAPAESASSASHDRCSSSAASCSSSILAVGIVIWRRGMRRGGRRGRVGRSERPGAAASRARADAGTHAAASGRVRRPPVARRRDRRAMGGRYLARKIVQAILTIAFIVLLNFILFRMMPGSPDRVLARNLPARRARAAARALGPRPAAHPGPARRVRRGDRSRATSATRSSSAAARSSDVLAERIWPTLILFGLGEIIAIVVGLAPRRVLRLEARRAGRLRRQRHLADPLLDAVLRHRHDPAHHLRDRRSAGSRRAGCSRSARRYASPLDQVARLRSRTSSCRSRRSRSGSSGSTRSSCARRSSTRSARTT